MDNETAARLAAIKEGEPDEFDKAMLAEAAIENDESDISLDEFKAAADYSGKLLVRIPKTLHKRLAMEAKEDGVSLNQYILFKLAQ